MATIRAACRAISVTLLLRRHAELCRLVANRSAPTVCLRLARRAALPAMAAVGQARGQRAIRRSGRGGIVTCAGAHHALARTAASRAVAAIRVGSADVRASAAVLSACSGVARDGEVQLTAGGGRLVDARQAIAATAGAECCRLPGRGRDRRGRSGRRAGSGSWRCAAGDARSWRWGERGRGIGAGRPVELDDDAIDCGLHRLAVCAHSGADHHHHAEPDRQPTLHVMPPGERPRAHGGKIRDGAAGVKRGRRVRLARCS